MPPSKIKRKKKFAKKKGKKEEISFPTSSSRGRSDLHVFEETKEKTYCIGWEGREASTSFCKPLSQLIWLNIFLIRQDGRIELKETKGSSNLPSS